MSAALVAALHIKQTAGGHSPHHPPADVPSHESIRPFKSVGGLAEIHEALITLSVVKLELYIQSIGFMTPLEHLIEIKCQNG